MYSFTADLSCYRNTSLIASVFFTQVYYGLKLWSKQLLSIQRPTASGQEMVVVVGGVNTERISYDCFACHNENFLTGLLVSSCSWLLRIAVQFPVKRKILGLDVRSLHALREKFYFRGF